jgi:prepilin-type N-terminal cleavage/methylation domain-containing protein
MATTPPNATRGFTLVELLVVLSVFAVIAVAVTVVLMTSAHQKQRTTQRLEAEQSARAALDLMARDIRSAGYGCDRDLAVPQPAIAYVSSNEIILSENQLPYPDNSSGPVAPLAYDPASLPRPKPLDGTSWEPPQRYRTGAELIRYTLDANNDGVVDANDLSTPEGVDAASSPNPDDMVLLRQVYGDSTGNVAHDNGGASERVALIVNPGRAATPLFTVYLRGSSTPWNWANGPVPAAQLADIQRITLNVTATAMRPDDKGAFPRITLTSDVNATRSVPDFGAKTYSVSGYVFEDLNLNRVKDAGEPGIPGTLVRLGSMTSYTSASGYFLFRAAAGTYSLRHTPAMGYGSFSSPDTFSVTVTNTALTYAFADTVRAGGIVSFTAYDDANGNGSRDLTEQGLQGIAFSISPGSPGATNAWSNAVGQGSLFTSTGAYTLTCLPPDSLRVTTTNPVSGTIANHGTASYSFGLYKQAVGHVKGTVYTDANRNGVYDSGETGIANVWVGVTNDGGVTVLGYANTDANGAYDVVVPINDPPHTTAYTVYVVPPGGYFPTGSTAIGGLWVQSGATLTGRNFGMANYQIITLNASRVLSLAAADVIEADWQANKTNLARADQDLLLGADAGGTDNVSVWFNRYANSPLFSASPVAPDGYTRMAPNSVMSMAVDSLDKNDNTARPDLVTGTKYTANGNFFVWFTQGTKSNEGYLPTAYSTGQNYKTADNGDVQAVVTLDCGGGARPDIIVGTKSATAGQGSIEVWLNSDATTPTFTRDETFTLINGSTMGEVTGIRLADLDNDGDKDLIVCTRTSDYNGQLAVWENRGRTAGNRFFYRWSTTFVGDACTALACMDGDADGRTDLFVGTQRSTSSGRIMQYRNNGNWSFDLVRRVDALGFVQSLVGADFGGDTGADLAVGYRTSTTGYGGGVRIHYLDTGVLPTTGVDPSGGSVINMVPALAAANFNYGLNTTAPPTPYLTDLAAGLESSATTGALVVFIR